MFDVGIGGQENRPDPGKENIYPLPDNRTLFMEQFTAEPPSEPEFVLTCRTIDDIFNHYKPELFVPLLNENGQSITEQFKYTKLEDFHPSKLMTRSAFLTELGERKEDFESFLPKLINNRILQTILANPELKEAYIEVLTAMMEELENPNSF